MKTLMIKKEMTHLLLMIVVHKIMVKIMTKIQIREMMPIIGIDLET